MPTYNIDTTKKPDPDRPDSASAARNPARAAALREMDEKKSRGPARQRRMIGAAALLIVLLIAGATWAIKAHRAADQKAALLVLAKEDPREIRGMVESGKLSRDDVEKVFEDRRKQWEQQENKQLDEYFGLKTQVDRNKYLDKLIDEQEARRKEWEARAATRPTSQPTSRPTSRPTTGPWGRNQGGDQSARARSRMESGDPVRKAQRAAFQQAMRERMAARGIQPGRGMGGMGGRGGGGGRPGGGGGGRGG